MEKGTPDPFRVQATEDEESAHQVNMQKQKWSFNAGKPSLGSWNRKRHRVMRVAQQVMGSRNKGRKRAQASSACSM